MSIVSDGSTDTTPLIAMTDRNAPAIESPVSPVVTESGSVKSGSEVKVSRSGDWVPLLNEIPISNNTLNIAINSGEIRPNTTAMTTNTRTIAPKPVTTATAIPLRPDSIGGHLSTEKTQTVIITTTSDSVVNSSTTANKYGINKVIPISNHIALVTSPDGTSMLAVPMSSLVTKGAVNLKPTISSMPINNATLKAKSPIITPLKILPLIASTTASTTLNVPTISHSKNVQTLIAPASLSLAKGVTTASATASNPNLTIIPTITTSITKSVKTLQVNETSEESITTCNPSTNLETKEKIIKDEIKIQDKLQSPLVPPPLLSQSTSLSNVVINSQNITLPALTAVTPNATTNSMNANNDQTSDEQNKNKSEKPTEESVSTGIEEIDDVIQTMQWKGGIGHLPGSDLKFKIDEFGNLDMIREKEEKIVHRNDNETKSEDEEKDLDIIEAVEPKKEVTIKEEKEEEEDEEEGEPMKTCINCNQRGPAHTFIRQGRFCSKSCATLEANQLKGLITKRNAELSSAKVQETEKKKNFTKKTETIKGRKTMFETTDQNSVLFQTENSNQTIDAEVESNEDTNEEVEDVETDAGNYSEGNSIGPNFSWKQYLNKTNSVAAPLKCFNEFQSYSEPNNNFTVGMKLEGVDPQHPAKFCVLTVAEVCGFRIRLHFDGYKELFDFWVNADHNFIFAAGFCESTSRTLEPPLGVSPEEFNWNDYLQQTKSVAAPKQLFSARNWQSANQTNQGFKKGMKLEAVDRANSALVCVATVADIIGDWLLIHFDGWDDSYDYWAETSSPFIHAINWCRTKGRSLTPPKEYYRSSERFSWEEYLSESKAMAVLPRAFKTRPSNNFKVGMKMEAVDKRNPRLIRVCTISHRQSHCIKIHFDGWDEKYDYWVDDDCPDLHPVNWCHKTGHPLQPPPDSSIKKQTDGLNSCPTPGCTGIGHIRGPRFLRHYSAVNCPYTDSRLEYELPDRLGNRNPDEPSDELEESRVSPSQSPTPSESNSLNSKSQKNIKTQQIISNKSRKRKLGSSPTNGNGPASPSTNSESAKHSRPSTPSSVTNLASLQHSIFAMRMSQQQQEAPVCWDRHSKTTLPGIDKTKSKDVLLWSSLKVSEFIDQIPGCESVGQIFQDQLIDGEAFLLLNQNDIVKILGLKLGPAIKIYNSILVIRDNAINEDVV